MAGKRKTNSSKPGPDEKARASASVPTTIHLTPENLKLLKLGAVEDFTDMSSIVNQLIAQKYAGWHIRRGRAGEGASSNAADSPAAPAAPTVSIPGVMNRISQIHQRATGPLDSALSDFSDDQP